MIPESLFSPSQSPVSVLLKVLVSSSQSPVFVLFRVPFLSCSESRSRPPPNTFPILSVLFLHLFVLSPPPRFQVPSSPSSPLLFLLASKNSGTTRSRPAVRVVGSFQNGTFFFHFSFVHSLQSHGLHTSKRLFLSANCFPVLPQMY